MSRKRIKRARGYIAEVLDANVHTMQEEEYSCAVILPENNAKADNIGGQ